MQSVPIVKQQVMWKDVLDNKWYGPDPVIQRSRGAVCVFPQSRPDPIWIPERLTRKIEEPETRDDAEKLEETMVADSSDPSAEC